MLDACVMQWVLHHGSPCPKREGGRVRISENQIKVPVSVAIYDDTIIVGAWGDDDNGKDSGSAYIFVRNGDVWTHQDKLLAQDGAQDDWFSRSIGIYEDTVIIVGAGQDDDNGDNSGGSARIFVRSGITWIHQAKLAAPDGDAGDEFGSSVAIYNGTVVGGAPGDDDNGAYGGSAPFLYIMEPLGHIKQSFWLLMELLARCLAVL